MDETVLTVIGLAVVAFGLVSARAQKSVVTPPMAFLMLGFVIGGKGIGWVDPGLDDEAIHTLAELTLVVVLFTDASRIDLKLLRREHNLPGRLLTVGLPLSLGLGTLAASWLFTEWNVWEAAALAAIVAPIVFAMILLQESQIPWRQEIFVVAMTTVMLSVLEHGLTAFPAARWHARRLEVVEQVPLTVEHQPLTEMPFCCTADAHVNHSPSHRSHS